MARIIITGEREPYEVPDDLAENILAQVNDPDYKGRITIPTPGGGTRSVAKHHVRDVQIGRVPDAGAEVNVDSLEGRAQAEELQATLDAYQRSAEMQHELEWYGAPLEGHSEDADARLRASGIVGNAILGAAHWSTVQWALEQKLISRQEEEYTPWYAPGTTRPPVAVHVRWSIVADDKGGSLDPSRYNRFERVWRGVKELRSRRLYAQKRAQAEERARLDSLVESEPESPVQAAVGASEPLLPSLDL